MHVLLQINSNFFSDTLKPTNFVVSYKDVFPSRGDYKFAEMIGQLQKPSIVTNLIGHPIHCIRDNA